MVDWLKVTLMLLAVVDPGAPIPKGVGQAAPQDEARLVEKVRAIRGADYRGERDELRRLAADLDQVKSPQLAAYREYWRGFARWRRALNGFNQKPPASDLRDDLEAAVQAFKAALAAQPDWLEAQVGIVGCLGALIYLAADDASRRDAIVREVRPVSRQIEEKGPRNPRVLWLLGGRQLSVPPPVGGDVPLAARLYRRGLEGARDEGLAGERPPEWVPSWGAAENLMSLAYLYAHTPLANREAAQAYAEGALAIVPDWHYVRDILVPQIQALPAKAN